MTSTAAADIDVLAPAGTSVEFAGKSIEITPIRAGDLPRLIRTAEVFIMQLLASNVLSGDEDEIEVDPLQAIKLIGSYGEDFYEALSIVSRVPVDVIGDAEIDQVIHLANICMKVNRDFFTHRVAPLLADKVKLIAGDGATPSSS